MRVDFIETNIFRAPGYEPTGAPGEGEIWLAFVGWGWAGEFVEVSRCCLTRKPTNAEFFSTIDRQCWRRTRRAGMRLRRNDA